jgi:hypothetical protein
MNFQIQIHAECNIDSVWPGKVPGILDISFGPTFKHDRAQGFTHALVVDLADASALEVGTKWSITENLTC